MTKNAPAQLIRTNTPTEPGTYYSIIATGTACDVRRAEVLCGCCGKDVGLNTALVMTASGRPSHAECYERLGIANLSGANLSGANLTGANLTDANLTDANLTDAKFNSNTVWPKGFDPIAAGVVEVTA